MHERQQTHHGRNGGCDGRGHIDDPDRPVTDRREHAPRGISHQRSSAFAPAQRIADFPYGSQANGSARSCVDDTVGAYAPDSSVCISHLVFHDGEPTA